MEFMSRDRGGAPAPTPQPGPTGPAASPRERAKRIDWQTRSVRIEFFILTLGCAIILALVILWAIFAGNVGYNEGGQVKTNKYQAVFLNGGATSGSVAYTTYFGHITTLNDKYVVLKDVYYLTTATDSKGNATQPQLTKLGCQQLHSPYDEMVINRNQVAFWENLQDNGKVAQAIKSYQQQNPNGPNCSANNSTSTSNTNAGSSNTSAGNSNTNAGSSNTTTQNAATNNNKQ